MSKADSHEHAHGWRGEPMREYLIYWVLFLVSLGIQWRRGRGHEIPLDKPG